MLQLFVLCSVSLLLVSVSSQAPDDGDAKCTDPSRYASHQRRLMDSWDYEHLLPQTSTASEDRWITIDIDENSGESGVALWHTTSPVQCEEVTTVCGRDDGGQENWMITQLISLPTQVNTVQVMVNSTLEFPCNPPNASCVEDISLYVWETPNVNETLAADTTNYQFVSNVSNGTVVVEISGLTGGSGFYLGIRDNGTCVSVSRVLVYYTVCVPGTVGLVRVDQETAFSSAGDTVQGHCVQNSISTSSTNIPQLHCLETGLWEVTNCSKDDLQQCQAASQCACLPGFQEEVVSGETICSVCPVGQFSEGGKHHCAECPVGQFSEGGKDHCRQCPENNNTTRPGMGVCPCLNGYYRSQGSHPTDSPCIKPTISENGASPAAVTALTVLVIIFLLLSLILTSVLVYMCWKIQSKGSQTTNGVPDPTYEVPDSPSSDKVWHMRLNSTYGQGTTGQLEVNENISYGIVQP